MTPTNEATAPVCKHCGESIEEHTVAGWCRDRFRIFPGGPLTWYTEAPIPTNEHKATMTNPRLSDDGGIEDASLTTAPEPAASAEERLRLALKRIVDMAPVQSHPNATAEHAIRIAREALATPQAPERKRFVTGRQVMEHYGAQAPEPSGERRPALRRWGSVDALVAKLRDGSSLLAGWCHGDGPEHLDLEHADAMRDAADFMEDAALASPDSAPASEVVCKECGESRQDHSPSGWCRERFYGDSSTTEPLTHWTPASPDSAVGEPRAYIFRFKFEGADWSEWRPVEKLPTDPALEIEAVPLYAHPPAEPPEEEREWEWRAVIEGGATPPTIERFARQHVATARKLGDDAKIQRRVLGPWQDVSEEGGSDAG